MKKLFALSTCLFTFAAACGDNMEATPDGGGIDQVLADHAQVDLVWSQLVATMLSNAAGQRAMLQIFAAVGPSPMKPNKSSAKPPPT